jgi:hypothetical protein
LPRPCQPSPAEATKKPSYRAFLMGGTGLEPVTPSLSIWCGRSRQFAANRPGRMVVSNPLATERLRERERTPNVAIVATRTPDSLFAPNPC